MALETTTNRVTYSGNGATTVFSFPYYFLADEDLKVVTRVLSTGVETTKTLTTHYTVSGEGEEAGGTVTFLAAPATGTTVIIYRDVAIEQDLDLEDNGVNPATQVEQRLDKLTMIAQRLDERADRSVRLTDGNSQSFDPQLPALITASRTIVTNAAGTAFEMGPTTDEISEAQGYAEDAADSAVAALASEGAAAASETAAAASETAAAASETAAAASESAAAASETAAAASEAAAAASETAAAASETAAAASEAAAAVSETNAADSEAAAAASETAAAASETAAAASEAAAAVSETNAAASAASAASALNSAFFRDVVYITSASSPVTVSSTHNGKLFSIDSSGGAITINLPSIAGVTMPFNVAFALGIAGNDVTINRNGTDTFVGGATSKVLSGAGTGLQCAADTDASPDSWTTLDFGGVADGAINAAKLAASAITGQTAETAPAADDVIILYDTSATALRKMTKSNFGKRAITSQSGTYTVLATDEVVVMSGASWTATLPAASGLTGKVIEFIHNDAAAGRIYTIDGNASETVGGTATRKLGLYQDTLKIICDGTNWQVLKSERVAASYSRATAQTLSNSTPTVIDFATSAFDSHGAVSGSGSSWVFTAPRAGIYSVVAKVTMNGSTAWAASETLWLAVYKNSGLVRYLDYRDNNSSGGATTFFTACGSTDVSMSAGDTLAIWANQASGGSLDLVADGNHNFVSITAIGG